MAIRGSLAEAGLPDVLQLLALGQKTGCLSVARAGDFGSIFFERGRVVHASLVNRRDRLGELLMRRGPVTAAASERHARTQVEEAVLELFTWAQGTFSFEPEVRVELAVPPLSLDASSLLLEGARRADERARIAPHVPGRDAIFTLAEDAPRDGAGALDVSAVRARGIDLSEGESRAARHVDGRRDVAQIAEAAGVVEFDAMRALFALVESGLARRAGASAAPDARAGTRVAEHRNLGVAFFRASLLDEAVRELRRVLELSPTDGHARFHLGLIALRRRRWAEAAAVLGEAAAIAGAPAVVFHALAVARAEHGELDEAGEALDEAARRGLRDDARTTVLRGALALRAGRVAEARTLLGDVPPTRGSRPAPAPWYHYAAIAAARSGDGAAAAAILEAGVAAHPRAATLAANLAAHRLASGRAEEALRLAETALVEEPSLAVAHKTAGDAHYRLGRHDAAAAYFERAVASAPALGAGVYLRLGNVRLRQGDRAAAAAAWHRSLALDPGHAIARGNLAAIGHEVPA